MMATMSRPVPPRTLRRRDRPRLVAEFRAEYENGASITSLMARGPYRYGTVLGLLIDAGVSFRTGDVAPQHRGRPPRRVS